MTRDSCTREPDGFSNGGNGYGRRTRSLQLRTKIFAGETRSHTTFVPTFQHRTAIQQTTFCDSTMSLTGMHTPHVSMSSNFSSSLGLAELLAEYEHEERVMQQSPRIDERTPFLGTKGTHQHQRHPVALNATLLLTIIVVTIGSSFQFGYATGENRK